MQPPAESSQTPYWIYELHYKGICTSGHVIPGKWKRRFPQKPVHDCLQDWLSLEQPQTGINPGVFQQVNIQTTIQATECCSAIQSNGLLMLNKPNGAPGNDAKKKKEKKLILQVTFLVFLKPQYFEGWISKCQESKVGVAVSVVTKVKGKNPCAIGSVQWLIDLWWWIHESKWMIKL